MFYISEIFTTPPDKFNSPLHGKIYDTLQTLGISFERVDNDPAVTMQDCVAINEKLNVRIVKTLFLCNRQKTSFYLYVTTDDKPFVTKDFSKALNISRVSFAPEEIMLERLGTRAGAATVFGTLLDAGNEIQVVIDRDILQNEWYGCTDGTVTGYMRVKTKDIFDVFLPYVKHTPLFI